MSRLRWCKAQFAVNVKTIYVVTNDISMDCAREYVSLYAVFIEESTQQTA